MHGFENERFAIAIRKSRGEFQQTFAFARVGGHTFWRGGGFAGHFDLGVERAVLTQFSFSSFEAGGVESDLAQPTARGAGVAEFVTVRDEAGGDFLEEVFKVGPLGFVGEDDGRNPPAVVLPELLETRAIHGLRIVCERVATCGLHSGGIEQECVSV